MYKLEDIHELPQNDDVRAWLLLQLNGKDSKTLLAFADDGVIWGRWDGKALIIAHEVDPTCPKLRGETLQQAYLFDSNEEVRLFRDELGNKWKAKTISSDASDLDRVIVEKQILWGDKLDKEENQPERHDFMRLLAERKGISPQVFPIKEKINSSQCVKLEVHHLVDYNKDGEAYIVASRLARLSVADKSVEV